MQYQDEYKTTVMGFKNLRLDTALCSPGSLNLSHEQLLRLLEKVHNNLPPHLKTAEKLKISVQASFCTSAGDRVESIQIHSAQSPIPMISYQVAIKDNAITFLQAFARPFHRIRTASLTRYENNQLPRKYVIIIVDDDINISMIMSR
jgi:hypothetical protein